MKVQSRRAARRLGELLSYTTFAIVLLDPATTDPTKIDFAAGSLPEPWRTSRWKLRDSSRILPDNSAAFARWVTRGSNCLICRFLAGKRLASLGPRLRGFGAGWISETTPNNIPGPRFQVSGRLPGMSVTAQNRHRSPTHSSFRR